MHRGQFGVAPIADRVETPACQPRHRLLAPPPAPIGAEFALEVGGIKIEGVTMIKGAPALGAQAAAIVCFAPMRGKLAFTRRQIAKHELAAFDISRPGKHDRVDAD